MAYNSKVVNKVLNAFDDRQKSAVAEAEKKKKELHDKIPGLRDIDISLSGTYIEIAGIMLDPSGRGTGAATKIDAVKKKNQSLRKKRKQLLRSEGYPENYTEPVYECALCEDSGYKNEQACSCLKKALAAESANSSGLGRIINSRTFANFRTCYYGDEKYMITVLEDCGKFVSDFGKEHAEYPEVRKNLIFRGSAGLGKTHLSSAIALEIIEKGFDVFYDSAQSILYSFEKERFSRPGTVDPDIIERYMTCDLLIIDDLGTEYPGSMSVAALYNLINMRLIDSKSMIISTNLTGDEFKKKYDERIVSRIFGEFSTFTLEGDDIRFKKE
jgi:DNA replication protein DnaC